MLIDFPAREQISQLRQLWQEAFGDSDAFLDCFFETAFSFDRSRCVTKDEKVAAALYWFDCSAYGEKYAYLYAVATAEAYRGQGLCRALMENVESLLAARGYAGAILVPAAEGLSKMYGNMGYRYFGGKEKVAHTELENLTKIDTSRYAALRRKLLPTGGVIQEGENLAFLEKLADFYEGEGVVVAVSRESGEIVERLDLTMGFDRAQPFAMCKLLGHGKTPGYFGISFG